MPGRVKHRHSTTRKPTIQVAQRIITARIADATDSGSSIFQNNTADPERMFNTQTIVWLVIVSLIVVATLTIVACLLCRCRRAKRKRHSNGHSHHPSLEVTDGRNAHFAWNKTFAPMKSETEGSGSSLTPPSKAAVRPAGDVVHPGDPVIVEGEEVLATPVYVRNKGSRYYSGFSQSRLSSAWKRISQIGRAY